MPELKYRTVTVEGLNFEVPTNVYWKTSRRCWQVSVRLDKKSLTDNFHPEQYNNDLQQAFEAACQWAIVKRQYPSRERHVSGFRLSHRCLDGRPPLPLSIGYRIIPATRGKGGQAVYEMQVWHSGTIVRSCRIGPVDGYTDEQYDRALRICKHHLKKIRALRDQALKLLDRTRQEAMSRTSVDNPFSSMLYSLEKHHSPAMRRLLEMH